MGSDERGLVGWPESALGVPFYEDLDETGLDCLTVRKLDPILDLIFGESGGYSLE